MATIFDFLPGGQVSPKQQVKSIFDDMLGFQAQPLQEDPILDTRAISPPSISSQPKFNAMGTLEEMQRFQAGPQAPVIPQQPGEFQMGTRPIAPANINQMSPLEQFQHNRRLEAAGIASTDPNALPPITATGPAVQINQGGGSVTMPEADYQRIQAQRAGVVGGGTMPREVFIENKLEDIAIRGGRSIIEQLRGQGMEDADIQQQAGITPQMSATQAYRKLAEFNNKEAGVGVSGQEKASQRTMDRIREKAGTSTKTVNGERVTESNQYQRFLDTDAEISLPVSVPTIKDDGTIDATSTKTVADYMSVSERNEYKRYKDRLANGVKSGEDRVISAVNKAKQRMQQEASQVGLRIQAETSIARRDKAVADAERAEAIASGEGVDLKKFAPEIKAFEDQRDIARKAQSPIRKQLEEAESRRVDRRKPEEVAHIESLYAQLQPLLDQEEQASRQLQSIYFGTYQQAQSQAPQASEDPHLAANNAAREAGQTTYNIGGVEYEVQ